MKPSSSKWRYVSGAACGLLLAAILSAASTWIVDGLIWSAVHRDADTGQLVHDRWLGLQPDLFLSYLDLTFLLLVPLGALLQKRPAVPALATPKAAAIVTPLAVIGYGAAMCYGFWTAQSWIWVLLD